MMKEEKKDIKTLSGSSNELERVHGLHERLHELCKRAGNPNAFARITGLSVSGIKRYLEGGEPSLSKAVQICNAMGVTINWLLSGQDAEMSTHINESDICFIDGYNIHASAGHGSLVDGEEANRLVPMPAAWLRQRGYKKEDLAAIWCSGDSMSPTMDSGDTLVVHLGRTKPKDGCIFVVRNDDTLWVKRLQDRFQTWALLSDNPHYPALEIPKDTQHTFQVVGQVVHVCKDLKD